MVFDTDFKSVLDRLAHFPRVFKFDFIPKDSLYFGETFCILSKNGELNSLVLENYIAEILARNDTRILYLDASIEFSYSKFNSILESLDSNFDIISDKITYIPIPTPSHLLLILEVLDDYLRANRDIRVVVINRLNFWSKGIFKEDDLNITLDICFRELKKLQSQFGFLLVYTKSINIHKKNMRDILQSHYEGHVASMNNKNMIILLIIPRKRNYEVFTFRLKRTVEMGFGSSSVFNITGFDLDNVNYNLIDDFYKSIEVYEEREEEDIFYELEELHRGNIDRDWKNNPFLSCKKV